MKFTKKLLCVVCTWEKRYMVWFMNHSFLFVYFSPTEENREWKSRSIVPIKSDITNYHFTLSISERLKICPLPRRMLASPHLLFCIKVCVSDRLRQQLKHHHVCHQVVIELMRDISILPFALGEQAPALVNMVKTKTTNSVFEKLFWTRARTKPVHLPPNLISTKLNITSRRPRCKRSRRY